MTRSSPIIFDAPSHRYDALPLLGVGRVVVGGDGLEHSPARRSPTFIGFRVRYDEAAWLFSPRL